MEFKKYEKVMTSCGLATVVAYNTAADRILLDAGTQYIVGTAPQYDGATLVWQWGHYYPPIEFTDAAEYLRDGLKTEEPARKIYTLQLEFDGEYDTAIVEVEPEVTYYNFGDDLQETVQRLFDEDEDMPVWQHIADALDVILGPGKWRYVATDDVEIYIER